MANKKREDLTDIDFANIELQYPDNVVDFFTETGQLTGDKPVGFIMQDGKLTEAYVPKLLPQEEAKIQHYLITSNPTFQDWKEKPSLIKRIAKGVTTIADVLYTTEREKQEKMRLQVEDLIPSDDIKAIQESQENAMSLPFTNKTLNKNFSLPFRPFPQYTEDKTGMHESVSMQVGSTVTGPVHDVTVQPMYRGLLWIAEKLAMHGSASPYPKLSGVKEKTMTKDEIDAYETKRQLHMLDVANEFNTWRVMHMGQTSESNYKDMIYKMSGVEISDEAAEYLANAKTFKGSVLKVISENAPYVMGYQLIAAKLFANNMVKAEAAMKYMKSDKIKKQIAGGEDPAKILIDYAQKVAFKDKHMNKRSLLHYVYLQKKFFGNVEKYGRNIEYKKIEKLVVKAEEKLMNIQTKIKNTTSPTQIERLQKLEAKQLDHIVGLKNNLKPISELQGVLGNESVAAGCGGLLYNLTGGEGWQVIGELGCGFAPIGVIKAAINSGTKTAEILASTMDNVTGLLDGITPFFSLSTDMRALVLGKEYTNLYKIDLKGNPKPLSNKEINKLKKFVDIFDTLPPALRDKTLARMKSTYADLEELVKGMDGQSRDLLNMTVADLSGLVLLHGLEELAQASVNARKITGYDITLAQNRINKMRNLSDAINTRINQIIDANPDLVNNGRYKMFETKIIDLNEKLTDALPQMEEDLLSNHVETLNLLKSKWMKGDLRPEQMQDELNLWQKKLQELSDNTNNAQVKVLISNIVENSGWEDDILTSIESFNVKLLNDNFSQIFLNKGLEQVTMDDLSKVTISSLNNYEPQISEALTFTFEGWKTLKWAQVNKSYDELKNATKIAPDSDKYHTVDVTDVFDSIFAQVRKDEPDLALAKLTSAYPPQSNIGKILDVFQKSASDEISMYIKSNESSEVLTSFAQRLTSSNTNIKFTDKFYDILAKDVITDADVGLITKELKKGMAQINNVSARKITDFDLFNMLRKDDAFDLRLKLDFEQGIQFKSGINKLESTAFSKKDNDIVGNFYLQQKLNLDGILLAKSKELGVDNLYIAANQNRYEYGLRFERDRSLGKEWSATRDVLKQDGKKIYDANAKAMAVDMDGGKIGIETIDLISQAKIHKLNPHKWVPTSTIKKWINNEAEAATFVNELERIFGKFDPKNTFKSRTGNEGFYFDIANLSKADKVVMNSLQAILTRQFANFLLESGPGKLLLDSNFQKNVSMMSIPDMEKLIKEHPHDLDMKKIQALAEKFTIKGSDGSEFRLIDIDMATDLSIGWKNFENATEVGQKTVRRLNKDLDNLIETSRRVVGLAIDKKKFFLDHLRGADVAKRFNIDLEKTSTFIDNVVVTGKFDDLVNVMKQNKVIKNATDEADFRKFGKELVAKYIKENFENPVGEKWVMHHVPKTGVRKAKDRLEKVQTYETDTLGLIKFLEKEAGGLGQIFTREELADINKFANLFNGENVGNTIKYGATNFTGIPRAMSVESWISRFYSINRDIISPKYVATESILQKMRIGDFSLLVETITNPELTTLIIKQLETGKKLNTKDQARFLELLKGSVVFGTIAKELAGQQALESEDTVGSQMKKVFGTEYFVFEPKGEAAGRFNTGGTIH